VCACVCACGGCGCVFMGFVMCDRVGVGVVVMYGFCNI